MAMVLLASEPNEEGSGKARRRIWTVKHAINWKSYFEFIEDASRFLPTKQQYLG